MKKYLFISALLTFFFQACTESGSHEYTDCGAVKEDRVENPVNTSDGDGIEISEIVDVNLLTGRDENGSLGFYLLHGLGNNVSESTRIKGMQKLASFGDEGLFFRAKQDCVVEMASNVVAIPGQFYDGEGKSFSEELLKEGLASVDQDSKCNSELVTSCQIALLVEGGFQVPSPDYGTGGDPGDGGDEIDDGGDDEDEDEEEDEEEGDPTKVTDFLWIPESARDGNVAVLVDPTDVRVVVSGDTLYSSGSGNGYGTIARGAKPGCFYGINVAVQVRNLDGDFLEFPDGKNYYIVEDGCEEESF